MFLRVARGNRLPPAVLPPGLRPGPRDAYRAGADQASLGFSRLTTNAGGGSTFKQVAPEIRAANRGISLEGPSGNRMQYRRKPL